ncbi:hypothetical protein HMI48_00865 [Acidithiobacillus ferrooxidans]|uniref:hypothetical protein n=1 Tax=Acidithiobacillus ferrooxidans TaxID=920 RepID=UPI001C0745F8|nr:hypothetical protein [Acidithiobacillus ferrooxidans]MBU2772513.1 hypothetical protein [Acidithiobacillus ferrooxidans]
MKKLHLFFLLACGALLSAPIAFAENISGTYVSNYSGTAVILQIVQLSGNQLQGRAEQVSLSTDGQRLNTWNYSASGAVSGDTIVLSLKNPASPQFLSGTIPMSGTLNGGDMQISGGSGNGTFTWILHRSSQSAFDRQVAALTAAANIGASRAANAKRQEERRKAVKRGQQIEIQAKKSFDEYCPYTANVEFRLKKVRDDFRKITAVMGESLDKERVTQNTPYNRYARNEIAYGINDDWYKSNNLGYNLNYISITAHYKNGAINLSSVFGDALRANAIDGCSNGALGFCADVNESFNRANQCNNELVAAFQKTYSVRDQETAKQSAIKQEAASLAGLSQ